MHNYTYICNDGKILRGFELLRQTGYNLITQSRKNNFTCINIVVSVGSLVYLYFEKNKNVFYFAI